MEEELEYLNKLRDNMLSDVNSIDKYNYELTYELYREIGFMNNIIKIVQEYVLITE